jgi:ariadne-1
MGNWDKHGSNTGGYYSCNKFKDENNDQTDVAKAKKELDRYLHYYKRFHAHNEAQKFAFKQLKETENRMALLQESSDNSTYIDVQFLKVANEQLVECRRVLKYTYAYAYYMNDVSEGKSGRAGSNSSNQNKEVTAQKKMQFEYHQEMLERFTETLSEFVEKPLLEIEKTNVVNMTRVVKTFMKNIIQYVEDGMEG